MSQLPSARINQKDDEPALAELPGASLIICSRNRPEFLVRTVQSVMEGDEVPAELILVDQSDESHANLLPLEHGRTCQIRYLWERSVGLSRARNVGVTAATHDILAFIDDDMFVSRNWFGSAVRALVLSGERSAVTGRVLATAPERPGHFAQAIITSELPAVYEGRVDRDVLAGCHMVMYRSTFAELGGFDERLGAGTPFPAEDSDFGFRLLEAGYRIVYEPEAVLYHRAWRAASEYWRGRWSYGRGEGAFYAKHWRIRDSYMPCRMAQDIWRNIRWLVSEAQSQPRSAYGHLAYVLGVLAGAGQWLLTERRLLRVTRSDG
jgi:GT2 family glycosyltransferase